MTSRLPSLNKLYRALTDFYTTFRTKCITTHVAIYANNYPFSSCRNESAKWTIRIFITFQYNLRNIVLEVTRRVLLFRAPSRHEAS